MTTVPTIGGTRGIFEIFVPGLFLFLNLVVIVYFFPFTDNATITQIAALMSNPALSVIILIVFGYLIGVILRLERTDLVDNWSGKYLRTFDANTRPKECKDNLYAYKNFPYLGWIGVEWQQSLPKEANDFYENNWARKACFIKEDYQKFEERFPAAKDLLQAVRSATSDKVYIHFDNISQEQKKQIGEDAYKEIRKHAKKDKEFFNFCKVMIAFADERAANEIYAAEALSRYIAEMFYALSLSFLLIGVTLILRLIVIGEIKIILLVTLLGYLLSIANINQL